MISFVFLFPLVSFMLVNREVKITKWLHSMEALRRLQSNTSRRTRAACQAPLVIDAMLNPIETPLERKQTWASPEADIPENSAVRVSEYWERLGKPKFVLAPMVSQSDLAFRRLCRKYGTNLCFTQMIHAQNFVSSKVFQDTQLDVYKENIEGIKIQESGWNALKEMDWDRFDFINPSNQGLINWRQMYEGLGSLNRDTRWTPYQEGISDIPSPLIVQIAGHDPKVLSEASRLILQRTNVQSHESIPYRGPVAGIDINCGCPQAIARSGRYGAFLMEENPNTVYTIIRQLRKELPKNVGVSVKIRIPEGGSKSVEGKRVLTDRIMRFIESGCVLTFYNYFHSSTTAIASLIFS